MKGERMKGEGKEKEEGKGGRESEGGDSNG